MTVYEILMILLGVLTVLVALGQLVIALLQFVRENKDKQK